MAEPAATDRAMSFPEALFLLFLGLRLSGHITWAWYWIAMPLIAQVVIGGTCAALIIYLGQRRSAMGDWLGGRK